MLEAALERAVRILCQPDDRGRVLRQELVRLERHIRNFTEAVAAGGDVSFLVAQLRSADDRRRELAARLEVLEATAHNFKPRLVLADLRVRLADWRSILSGNPVKARALVRQLIVGRLELMADVDRQGFNFTGTGTLVPLLSGIIPAISSVISVPQNGSSPERLDRMPGGFALASRKNTPSSGGRMRSDSWPFLANALAAYGRSHRSGGL